MSQSTVQFWIQKQMQRVESSCSLAVAKINAARDMMEVGRAAQITVPSEIRAVFRASPSDKRVRSAATRRLQELGKEHLALIEKAETHEAAKQLFGRYMSQDWQACRGDNGHVFTQLERNGRQILHKKAPAKPVESATPAA